MTKKSASRWLRRNNWKIAKFNLGMGSEKGSGFHRQLILCRRCVYSNMILYRRFGL